MKKNKIEWNPGYRAILLLLDLFVLILFRPRVTGKEHIPRKGAAVIAVNHKHAFDPILPLFTTMRVIRFMAKKEVTDSAFSWLFKVMRCIRVDRDAHDGKAMQEAIDCLRAGYLVGIFPEGTRNRTHDLEIQPLHLGAVAMARQTGAPVIPAVITGSYAPWNRDLMLSLGEPILIPPEMDINEANALLKSRMEQQWHDNLALTGRSEKKELNSRKLKKNDRMKTG